MREIMTRAWEIYRTLEGDRLAKMSMALRRAWAEAKAAKNAKPEFTGRETVDGFQFVAWEKYGKRRIYVNNYSGSNRKNVGGYIDVDTGAIAATGCVKSAAERFMREFNYMAAFAC